LHAQQSYQLFYGMLSGIIMKGRSQEFEGRMLWNYYKQNYIL
jgi:hypothetical protein